MVHLKEKRIVFLDPRNIKTGYATTDQNERYRLLLLSESIRENGLILPVTVRKSGGIYVAVCGEKRIKASILAGVKKIPCIVDSITEPELYKAVENFGKISDSVFLTAEKLGSLLKKYPLDKLACILGLSTKEITDILSANNLTSEAKQKLKEADIRLHLFEKLGESEENRQSEIIENVKKAINGENFCEENILPKKPLREQKISDKRFFINSIRKIADTMKQSGIDTVLTQSETAKTVEIKIRIKKTKEDDIQLSFL